MLSIKIRLSLMDVLKILFGRRVYLKNPYDNDRIYWICLGKTSYMAKNK